MTPEDADLWKKVTKGLAPLLPKPSAPVIRPAAPLVPRLHAQTSTLDLHGMTLTEACAKTHNFVREARYAGLKSVVVITGLSGAIRREFPFWVENLPGVRKIDLLNGGGAFKVYFLKKR